MNERKTPGATDGPKDETIIPAGVAQPSQVKRPDPEELNETEEHAAEMEKAKQSADPEAPFSSVRRSPD